MPSRQPVHFREKFGGNCLLDTLVRITYRVEHPPEVHHDFAFIEKDRYDIAGPLGACLHRVRSQFSTQYHLDYGRGHGAGTWLLR